MGVLPLQFLDEKSFADYGISGKEIFSLSELNDDLQPQQNSIYQVDEKSIPVLCRLDTPVELRILPQSRNFTQCIKEFHQRISLIYKTITYK